jgi:hypothetical protein
LGSEVEVFSDTECLFRLFDLSGLLAKPRHVCREEVYLLKCFDGFDAASATDEVDDPFNCGHDPSIFSFRGYQAAVRLAAASKVAKLRFELWRWPHEAELDGPGAGREPGTSDTACEARYWVVSACGTRYCVSLNATDLGNE